MTIINLRFTFVWAFLILCFGNTSLQCQPTATRTSQASVLATWKGESICAGNRPACKNEVVVYRFEAVAGKPDMVLQLADKIINDNHVPMGKMEFRYDEGKRELSCEFTRGQTHGLWQFKVTRESMEGTLVLLPDRELVRRVNVKKVRENEVPMPPARESYDGL